MRIKTHFKKYWWAIIAAIWLVSVKILVVNPVIELKRQKQLLISKEKEIIPKIEECTKSEDLNEKFKKVRKAQTLHQNASELNKLLNEIISPRSFEESDMKCHYDLGQKSEHDTEIHYPINLEIESSFHSIGDYLEYMEASYLPVLIDEMTISPSKYEFDKIKIQLAGNLYLSK